MAAIDCCYIDNYKDYLELKDFLKDKKFKTPRGVEIDLSKLLYPWDEKDFLDNEGKPKMRRIFNTPCYVDNWLYHNCNIPFIQEWLEDRYHGDDIITKELRIPEYEPCTKVKVIQKGWSNYASDFWIVDVSMKNPDYPEYRNFLHFNEDLDCWILPYENDEWTISGPFLRISVRAIIRKIIKKWKLPKGCRIVLWGRWVDDEWILETK